ncbi:nucleotide-binding universal stress UspA family protein [Bradyrhizobium elkanii]|uniref:universal stress protein n=1 Tax=Bradyrhizobium TaxID=374 RepID=UPI002169987B|nr:MULTISPECIES: universal stress protein [Bradyrhizobium]MCS3928954.1 nucleotide-binding universal stress UspA family protein [Bradyrhizobium elkanii]MCS3969510.1 nucleotide-binding universal stress UspA family protein [Bradyrhizobium japonicum]
MIKDVMVRLDGTSADDARLAAAAQIAAMFDGHITGLFFNVVRDELDGSTADQAAKSRDAARQAGDATETVLFQRLTRLQLSTNLRRFDVAGDLDMSEIALPVARTADTFVALRPNGGSNEPQDLIDNLLFGTGRHLFLVPDDWTGFKPLDSAIVAWNGSRESARALAEALPLLHAAEKVGVLVVEGERQTRTDPLKANDAVQHLRHHGIDAVKYRAVGEEDDTADILVAECRSLGANLLVMGSYGHSGLHELLPGSTTTRILRIAPMPLLIAH